MFYAFLFSNTPYFPQAWQIQFVERATLMQGCAVNVGERASLPLAKTPANRASGK
jgi:hypothetical protein